MMLGRFLTTALQQSRWRMRVVLGEPPFDIRGKIPFFQKLHAACRAGFALGLRPEFPDRFQFRYVYGHCFSPFSPPIGIADFARVNNLHS